MTLQKSEDKEENTDHFYPTEGGGTMKKLTPIKAIRVKCVDCSGGSYTEVTLCTVTRCPLYPYRTGHRPKAEHFPTEEDKEEKVVG